MVGVLTMLSFATMTLAADVVEFKIVNKRPSSIAALLRLNKSYGSVEADDFKGVIRVWGATEDLERLARILPELDVKPLQFHLRFKVVNEVAKVSYDGTVMVPNNISFAISENESNVEITHTPRMLETGRVWHIVRVRYLEAKFEAERTTKSAEQFVLKVPEMTPKNEQAKKALLDRDPRLWPVISLSAALVEKKP